VRLLIWPLGAMSLVIQVLVVAALYYAIADVARGAASGHLALAGIGNITHTAIDVCCTLTRDGKPVLDAAGTPQHGDYLSGLVHSPGAVALPVLAAVFTVLQAAIRPRLTAAMSQDQQRAARAARQTSVLSALMIVVAASLLPEALALAMATQSAWMLVQAVVLRRWAAPRPQPAGAPATGPLQPISSRPHEGL